MSCLRKIFFCKEIFYKTEASISAICKLVSNEVGLSIYKILFACCSAVVFFPHHLGPSIKIAPLLAIFLQASDLQFDVYLIYLIFRRKYTSFFYISSVGRISFP